MSKQTKKVPLKVFISYSWDSQEHKDWVAGLANILRKEYGINAVFDENADTNNLDKFMVNEILSSDKIVVVVTKNYTIKANQGEGGVGVEYKLYTKDISDNDKKIIPIIKENTSLPELLLNIKYIDFLQTKGFLGYPRFEELVKRIKDITTYELPKPTKKREVRQRKPINPIFHESMEELDVHIVDFKQQLDTCLNDAKVTYDFLTSIKDKYIRETYIPSLVMLYDFRKENKLLFVEEQILWANIFSNIWSRPYHKDQGLERIIDLILTKNLFILKEIFNVISEVDSLELDSLNVKLEDKLTEILWNCVDINDLEVVTEILCFLFFKEDTEIFWPKFDKVDVWVKESFFNKHWYWYERSFRDKDVMYLKKYINLNDRMDSYLFDIFAKIKSFEAIELVHMYKKYTRGNIFNLLEFIAEQNLKDERNEEIILKAKDVLNSYPNKEYAKITTDKYLVDIVEYIIQKQDIDLFISRLGNIKGTEDDLNFIIKYINGVNVNKIQRKKLNNFCKKCKNAILQ